MRPAVLIAGAYLGLLGLKSALVMARKRHHPPASSPSADQLKTCVIAQPILSGDPDLMSALRANRTALAGCRLLWLIDDDDLEAQRITDGLAAESSGHRLEIVRCPPSAAGVNPKVDKLARALERCHDDEILVVVDDDVRLPVTSLGALLDGLDQAAVSTGLPAYLPRNELWSDLVAQFVNDNAIFTYLAQRPFSLNGMTYALRVADLRAMGGFDPLRHTLTDDLAVATMVREHDGTIVQTRAPQWVSTTVPDARAYRRLMHRWNLFAVLLLREAPIAQTMRLGGLHTLHPILAWALVVATIVDPRRNFVPSAIVLVARAAIVRAWQRQIYRSALHRPLLSVLAELAQPFHLIQALCQRTIIWRTRRFRVRSNDDFSPA